jgi:hypothetical protein
MEDGHNVGYGPGQTPLPDNSAVSRWRWLWLLVPIALFVGLILWFLV